jgi:AraC-like DNA-binding protein
MRPDYRSPHPHSSGDSSRRVDPEGERPAHSETATRARTGARILQRRPRPALRPFVTCFWAIDHADGSRAIAPRREHVLPTGTMHLAIRFGEVPLRLFAGTNDTVGRIAGHAVVGGTRSSFYVRDVSTPVSSVGVQLRAGAAHALLGVPADELAERHTSLDALWGSAATRLREQLAELPSPEQRLDVLADVLAARLPRAHGLHPAIAQALDDLARAADVRDVVARSGCSHRRFIALFRQWVGLPPKLYARVLRFQQALRCATSVRPEPWIEVSMEAGYSDQPHFSREFREFTGVTPTDYRRASPVFPYHLPVDRLRSR